MSEGETQRIPESEQDSPEVLALLEEMREKNGKIIAHPYMYVSGLHNKSACYPVDQNDPFFTRNGIEFLKLAEEGEEYQNAPELKFKYVICLDDTGAYKHVLVKNDRDA